MKLVRQNAQIFAITGNKYTPYNYSRSSELIEVVGRTCYKSENNITATSANTFVHMLHQRGHYAMLEHSWVAKRQYMKDDRIIQALLNSEHLRILCADTVYGMFEASKEKWTEVIVVGNMRAIENWEKKMKSFSKDKSSKDYYSSISQQQALQYAKRYNRLDLLFMTIKFVTDRGITHEQVRHRPVSYAQESTRYCNYSKDKFDNSITYCIPSWITDVEAGEYQTIPKGISKESRCWMKYLFKNEKSYFEMLKLGWPPEKARGHLAHFVKTEIVVTATLEQWFYMFDMRYTGIAGVPHVQMKALMGLLIPKVNEQLTFMHLPIYNIQ